MGFAWSLGICSSLYFGLGDYAFPVLFGLLGNYIHICIAFFHMHYLIWYFTVRIYFMSFFILVGFSLVFFWTSSVHIWFFIEINFLGSCGFRLEFMWVYFRVLSLLVAMKLKNPPNRLWWCLANLCIYVIMFCWFDFSISFIFLWCFQPNKKSNICILVTRDDLATEKLLRRNWEVRLDSQQRSN